MGTKNDGILRILKGYVYLGGYVLNYLLKVTEGTLFTKGTFILHHIVFWRFCHEIQQMAFSLLAALYFR